MPPKAHSDGLFKRHPLKGESHTSAGSLPTPYHVYDGRAVLVGGTGDLGAVHELLKGERVVPVWDTDGRALVALWICDFIDASLGPHKELQIAILVTRQPIMPVTPHPLAVLRLLLVQPGIGILCHGLWNDTNTAVAYNREVVGLNARLANAAIEHDAHLGITAFSFLLAATSKPIASGMIADTPEQSKEVTQMLKQSVGLRGQLELIRQQERHIRVINPSGKHIAENLVADTYTRAESQTLRLLDPDRDTIIIEDEGYRRLGLWPQFIQHMEGFKFVYVNPRPWGKQD